MDLIRIKLFIIIIYLNFNGIYLASFKLIYFKDIGKIFSICDKTIYVYKTKNLEPCGSYTLTNDQIINSSDESKFISSTSFFSEDFEPIFIIIKDYLYVYVSDQFIGNHKINDITNKQSSIITYECKYENSEPFCYLYIAIIDDSKNLKVFKYKYQLSKKELTLIKNNILELKDSLGNNSKSNCDNVSCQIMTYSNKNVLTCFYENENTELVAININLETLEQNTSKKLKLTKNSGATIIKSALYSNNQKALVCYINYKNNLACIIYEINGNQWLLEYKYIEECSPNIHLFNLDYYSDKSHYILSCFTSDSNMEYAILNDQLDINDNSRGSYCLTTKEFEYCSGTSAFAVIYEAYNYFIERVCSFGEGENISKYDFSESCNKNYTKERIIIDEDENNKSTLERDEENDDQKIDDILTFEPEESELDDVPPSGIIPNKGEIINMVTNKTLDEVTNNFNKIIQEIKLDNVYIMKNKDYIVKIRPIDYKDLFNNSTSIDFLECEKTLRRINNISPSSELYLVTLEIYKKNQKSLTNQVEYEIYDEKKNKLDLSVCDNEEIEIHYSISNSSLLDKEKINYFSELGIDILNSKDVFFNDICFPYSEKSTDVILNDRIEYIYQNYSMCDENCNYYKIDLKTMTITCKCGAKKKVNTELEKLTFDHILLDIVSNSSIGVVKCYNLVFNFKTKLDNLGFWIFAIIFLVNASFIIHYFIYGIIPIKKYIVSEMIKYNYLDKFQNPNKKTKGERVNIFNFEPITHNSMKLKKSKLFTINNEKEFNSSKKQVINNINIYRKKLNESNNSKDKISLNSFNRLTNSTKYLKFKLSKKDKKNIKDKTNTKIENQYFMIQISANNSKNNKPPESKFYLTNYDFEEALQYDKRTFWGIYYICLLAKENILNMLYIKSPLELKSLRLCVFVFMYSCDLTFNTLFYFNSNISDRYHYEGKSLFWFSLLNNIAITIISSILSFLLSITLNFLTNSKEDIEEIFRKEEKKMRKDSKYIVSKITKREMMLQIYEIIKKLKIKILFFIILECTLLLFFFYFVTAFCEVYQKTQVSWLCDSFTSFIFSFPIEFLLAFVNTLLYKISLAKKSSLLYKIVIVFYNLS